MVALATQNDEYLQFGSGSLLKDLIRYSGIQREETSNILVFVGDPCQLGPIGEKGGIPPALDSILLEQLTEKTWKTITLTSIYRQATGGGILFEAVKIRQGILEKKYDRFRIACDNQEVLLSSRETLCEEYLSVANAQEKILIAQKRRDVWDYNLAIRHFLGRSNTLVVGEQLMSLRNTHAMTWDGGEQTFTNGEFLSVVDIPNTPCQEIEGFYRPKGEDKTRYYKFTFQRLIVKWMSHLGVTNVDLLVNITPLVSEKWRNEERYASIALFNGVKDLEKESRPKPLTAKQLLFLHAPIVTYGYAITGHKSQGGEWKDVWVDYSYAQSKTSEDFFRWAYTATTRARERLHVLSAPKIDVLFDQLKSLSPNMQVQETSQTLKSIVESYGWNVKEIKTLSYRYRIYIQSQPKNEQAREEFYFDLVYNGKNKITNVDKIGALEPKFSDALKKLIGQSVEKLLLQNENCEVQGDEIDLSEVNERHLDVTKRIWTASKSSDVKIYKCKSLTDYHLKIFFEDDTRWMEIYFKGGGKLSKVIPHNLTEALRLALVKTLQIF